MQFTDQNEAQSSVPCLHPHWTVGRSDGSWPKNAAGRRPFVELK